MKTILALLLLSLAAPAVAAPPDVLNFSGHLSGASGSLTGEITLTVSLYDDPDSFATGHVLWSETSTVFVSGGRFHVLLGADGANALPPAALDAAALYVGVRVGSDDELRPRLRVASVPFALLADDAGRLGGLAPDAYAAAGHAHELQSLLGQVAQSQLPGEVALDAELAAGLATRAAAVHEHDAAYVNEGQADAVDGAMVRDGSLLLTDLGQSGCADGQLAKWSDALQAWVCAADVDTTVSAGTGVTIADGQLSLDRATVVGWAAEACFDAPIELHAALDARYAPAEHDHDERYPLAAEVEASLAAKADTGHLHDARYPLASDVTAALAGKAALEHDHDGRYYTREQDDAQLSATSSSLQAAIATKADAGHLHDARYPLASDVTTALAGKAALGHEHDAAYVNEGQSASITSAMLVDGAVSLQKLADGGCTQGQVAKWDDANGRWACADDRVGDYTGNDFALANQSCPFGQVVAAVDTAGQVVCATDVVYGPGTGLLLVGAALSVDKAIVEGWAAGVCYDKPAELAAALDTRYAALVHTHSQYATYLDMNGALAIKADLFHDHADLYYLKDEGDARYVNEGQADAVTGAMVADASLTLADLGASACVRGQIAKRVAGTGGGPDVWGCTADNDTQYTPGTGLTLTTGRFDVVQGTVEGWARGVAYDTPAELVAAVPAWDQQSSDDLTTATQFKGQVTGTYDALALGSAVVTSATIANGAVTTVDLAPDSVTTAIILNGTVGTADLAAESVTTAAVANGTLSPADFATGAVTSAAIADGAVSLADMGSESVSSAAIVNGTIQAADLGADSVTSSAIASGSVGAAELAPDAVTSAAILNGTIGTVDLAGASVTSAILANGTVATVDLANEAVTSAIIANGTIVADDLAADSVTSAAILNGTVGTGDLASGAVTSIIIANGTVATVDLANEAVTSAIIANATIANVDLAAGSVNSASILNYSIATVDLADGAVGSNQIANGVVMSSHLADASVTTAAISNGTIGADDLAAGAVTSAALANGAVGAVDLAVGAVSTAAILNGTIGADDLAGGAITSAAILNGTITAVDLAAATLTDAQISATAAIAPTKIAGTAWTASTDGSGSGLDADLLDGAHASAFAAASHNHDGVYVATTTALLQLVPTATATCAASNVGEVRLTTAYNLCICRPTTGSNYGWRLPDGTTACTW